MHKRERVVRCIPAYSGHLDSRACYPGRPSCCARCPQPGHAELSHKKDRLQLHCHCDCHRNSRYCLHQGQENGGLCYQVGEKLSFPTCCAGCCGICSFKFATYSDSFLSTSFLAHFFPHLSHLPQFFASHFSSLLHTSNAFILSLKLPLVTEAPPVLGMPRHLRRGLRSWTSRNQKRKNCCIRCSHR